MRRGYAIGLCILGACSSNRSWTTGEESEEILRGILARRDYREAAFATRDAVYVIHSGHLTTELRAVLDALGKAPVSYEPEVFSGASGVSAWPRVPVLELQFDEGLLHVRGPWRGTYHVAFKAGREIRWMEVEATDAVRDAAGKLGDAAARVAETIGPWVEAPLGELRDIGIRTR